MDNDCIVPTNWLNKLLDTLERTSLDIVSPNVYPSNAAYKYGEEDKKGLGYRPTHTVGGLWLMRKSLIEDVFFEPYDIVGIKGAYNLLYQIIIEKEPAMGWVTDLVVHDVGHWSGRHPMHIKTTEHEQYYQEVGRNVAW